MQKFPLPLQLYKTVIRFLRVRPWLVLLLLTIASIGIVFTRNPDAFLLPQFWAEDGKYWYADAYNHGVLRSLFMDYVGSLQLFTRFIGSLSIFLPLSLAPLFFMLVAVAVQILPVILINTKRFSSLIPRTWVRLLICFCYLGIPNSFEVHANLTNANWHLALVACMVLVGPLAKQKAWKLFDYPVLLFAGLTGPFAVVLAAIAWIRWYTLSPADRKEYRMHAWIVSACALVQLVVLLLAPASDRLTRGLGASPGGLLSIIGVRLGAASMLGMNYINTIPFVQLLGHGYWLVAAYMLGVLLYALWKAPLALKLFILFTWGIFAAALIKPQASQLFPQWEALIMGAGNRYFFLPMLSWIVASFWLVGHIRSRYLSYIFVAPIVLLITLGIPRDWGYTPLPDLHFSDYVQKFEAAPSHQHVCMPINPDWVMCLDKR